MLEHGLQSTMFTPNNRAETGTQHVAFETVSFVLESERYVCQQRNAANGMACKGEEDQTISKYEYETCKNLEILFETELRLKEVQ